MSFCLPQELTKKFIQAIKDGTISPEKMIEMSSDERRSLLEPIVGKENVREVNAELESKLILKDQNRGMVSWAKKVSGISEKTRSDLVKQIAKIDRVLGEKDRDVFLNDFASRKLGTDVTIEEANRLSELSKTEQTAKEDLQSDPNNKSKQIEYGRRYLDVSDYVESLKPKASALSLTNILNLPKSALTSVLHFSAPFVQGWGMMSTRPFWEGARNMFTYFASPDAYRDLHASIIGHPDYKFAIDGRLGITKLGDKLTSREEAIQSSLLEHIPGLRSLVKASSRGFTGFLNYVRFSRFSDLLSAARLAGENVSVGSKVVKDIANVVNDFTGRGNLPGNLNMITPELNAAFFSPRKIAATVQMFNPVRYLDPRISGTARMGALRQLTGSILFTGTMLELAHLAGASVNLNPTSTNFAKMKWGNSTLDMTGGNAIYIRLIARLVSGRFQSAAGNVSSLNSGKFGSQTRASLLFSFLRDKLSPTASTIADLLYGSDAVGQPITISSEVKDKLTPIIISDVINLAQNDPNNAAIWIPGISAIFGVSLESSAPRKK